MAKLSHAKSLAFDNQKLSKCNAKRQQLQDEWQSPVSQTVGRRERNLMDVKIFPPAHHSPPLPKTTRTTQSGTTERCHRTPPHQHLRQGAPVRHPLQYNMSYDKLTERESLYTNLEHKTTRELLTEINHEDQKVAIAVEAMIPQMEKVVEHIARQVPHGGRVFYIGAGTSGRLGALDASEIPPTYGMPENIFNAIIAGGDKALRHAVEHAEDNPNMGWHELLAAHANPTDTIIGITASGSTPFVVGALHKAREKGIFTACITSVPHSPVVNEAQVSIVLDVGPEYVTGSTRMKSGTAQKMVLNMISTTAMIRLGRVDGNKMVHLMLSNEKLIDRGTRIVARSLHIDYDTARQLLLGKGSVAAALKQK